MNPEKIYPLALRLNRRSRNEIVKWFISWQINNPNNRIMLNRKRIDELERRYGKVL